jgi:pimeloyl-ACP methyl ester carboxylesterase
LPPQPTTWLTGLVLRVVLGRGLHGRDGASDAGWLAQRGVRVGLLHAVGDVVAPLGAARRIAQAAGAELRVLNGPGHTRLAQQDPGWHAEQLAGFFEELAQREPRRQTG